MGLFDDLLKSAVGGEAQDPEAQSRGLVEGLLDLLEQPDSGGVDGLARSFERQGLGAEAESWIGTGANRPVSSAQITQTLGPSQVDSLSRRAGLGSAAGAAAIAAILPALIDKLTPAGRAPVLRVEGRLEDGPQAIVVGLRNRIVTVVVTLRAADRQTEHVGRDCLDRFGHDIVSRELRVSAARETRTASSQRPACSSTKAWSPRMNESPA